MSPVETCLVQQFSVKHVIDVDCAVKDLGHNPNLFFLLLSEFEESQLVQSLEGIEAAIFNEDLCEVYDYVHKLKGSCAYVGAYRLYYACHFMQCYYEKEDYSKMVDYYP